MNADTPPPSPMPAYARCPLPGILLFILQGLAEDRFLPLVFSEPSFSYNVQP